MKKLPVVLVILLVVTLAFTSSSTLASEAPISRSNCRVWNLTADTLPRVYLIYRKDLQRDTCGNSGVWQFMQSSALERNPSTYSALQRFLPNVFGIEGLASWDGSYVEPHVDPQPLPNQPWIGINATGQPQQPLTIDWPAYAVLGHPAPEQLLVVRWQSPISGLVQVTGAAHDVDNHGGDGVLWFIDNGATNLAAGGFYDGGAQDFIDGVGGSNLNAISVKRGESLYFILHPNGNYLYDSTRLDISIVALR